MTLLCLSRYSTTAYTIDLYNMFVSNAIDNFVSNVIDNCDANLCKNIGNEL